MTVEKYSNDEFSILVMEHKARVFIAKKKPKKRGGHRWTTYEWDDQNRVRKHVKTTFLMEQMLDYISGTTSKTV